MLQLAADENFPFPVLCGLRQRQPDLDIVHVLEVGMQGSSDPEVLEWAASQNCVLITCDRQTMIGHAYDRINAALPMTGLVVLPSAMPSGHAIDDIWLLAMATEAAEWTNRVEYLPL